MSQRRDDPIPDPDLARRLREDYERHRDDLDPWVATRLAAARRDALRIAGRRQHAWRRWSLPVGLAFALALSLAVWRPWQPVVPAANTQATADDMEIMLSDDNLELYADLDFYAWLGDDDASVQ